MRIIDERKCQCHTCGNTLAYTEEDIHNNAGDSFIICPCCETRIFLVDGIPCSAMISCDNCNKSFELPSEYCDTYIGANGCEYTTCPHCGNEQWIGEGIELDKNNIIYPQHFYLKDSICAVLEEISPSLPGLIHWPSSYALSPNLVYLG